MRWKTCAIVAALAGSSLAGVADAQSSRSQMVEQTFQELQAEGYDVSGFENLTLSQIAFISSELEKEDESKQGLIQGMLNGTCGGTVVIDANSLRELMN
jgi:hypothetical protein